MQELVTCFLIALGRIADVTLGTVRTIFVVRGRRVASCFLGFFEVLIWICVAARVIHGLRENLSYAVSYALGFAAGNYLGITVERWLAYGTQVVQVFTRCGDELAARLRAQGFRLTQFAGHGRDGPTSMLALVTPRQQVAGLVGRVRELDPQCFLTVEDVRAAAPQSGPMETGWRGLLKRK